MQPRARTVEVSRVCAMLLRIVGKGLVLRDQRDDVHAEAVDALVQPEPHDVVDILANTRVFPVQIGLLVCKQMHVVFAASRIIFPRGTGKERAPVVWRFAVASGMPDVVPTVRVVLGTSARLLAISSG